MTEIPDSHSDANRPTDWWAWQARVRATVSGPVRPVAPRTRPPAIARVGLGLLVGAALVAAAAGGVVFGGRPSDATRPGPGTLIRTAPAVGVPIDSTGVGATLAGMPPVPVSEPVSEPAPVPPVQPPRAPPPGPRYAVEQLEFDATDPSRGTPERGDEPAQDVRVLHTVVRYPASSDGGPFPLVVFAHGYATSTAAYSALLDGIAASGFVVAAPEFPLTSTAIPLPVGHRDVVDQVGDVRFIIGAVRDLADAPDSPLTQRLADGPVGLVGHSDGGVTVAAAAFAKQMRDPRIGAAVTLSGAEADLGGAWFTSGSPAFLAIHGDADGVNPFASSEALYADDRSGASRYLVAVAGGGHTDAFVAVRTRPWVVVLIADFLRAALRGDAGARAQIANDASVPGALQLASSG